MVAAVDHAVDIGPGILGSVVFDDAGSGAVCDEGPDSMDMHTRSSIIGHGHETGKGTCR